MFFYFDFCKGCHKVVCEIKQMFLPEAVFIPMVRMWEQTDQSKRGLIMDCGGLLNTSPASWNEGALSVFITVI